MYYWHPYLNINENRKVIKWVKNTCHATPFQKKTLYFGKDINQKGNAEFYFAIIRVSVISLTSSGPNTDR